MRGCINGGPADLPPRVAAEPEAVDVRLQALIELTEALEIIQRIEDRRVPVRPQERRLEGVLLEEVRFDRGDQLICTEPPWIRFTPEDRVST